MFTIHEPDPEGRQGQTFNKYGGKGLLWSAAEVQYLLEIWADECIQEQLDATRKNPEIFGKIRD